jgi:hypothetical protein
MEELGVQKTRRDQFISNDLGARSEISRVATIPSNPGKAISIKTTSGLADSIIRKPARAVADSPTTSYPGIEDRNARIPALNRSWSSTRKIFMFGRRAL